LIHHHPTNRGPQNHTEEEQQHSTGSQDGRISSSGSVCLYGARSPDMNVASLFWGFSLAFTVFAAAKGMRQTLSSWQRRGRITGYVWLIWIEWFSSTAIGIISWLYLYGIIAPR